MKKIKMEEKILKEIKSNKVKMKPKWYFSLINGGIRGVWLLVMLAVSISISMVVYFLKVYRPMELIEYGDLGVELFLTDFPYLWLAGAIVFFVGGMILMSKIGDNYRKTTKLVLALMSVVVIVATIAVLVVRSLFKVGI